MLPRFLIRVESLVVFRRNYRRACALCTTGRGLNSKTRLHVGCGEVVALEKQGRLHRLGEGIDGAVAKIEARLGVNAFAVTAEGLKGERGKVHVVRDYFRLNGDHEEVWGA